MSSIVFNNASFAYDASPDGLFSKLRFGISEGWTGVIGSNGAGKTTLLRLACGELAPRTGTVDRPRTSLYCPQRTDTPMPEFGALLGATDGVGFQLRGRLGIGEDWLDRWETLSHGERKRAQIGACLWLRPDLLAVDEPTNHLDREAKRRVVLALRAHRGIGLLVSHDRDLLDNLCQHCLFVDPPDAVLRSGGYTVARQALAEEDDRARALRTKATRDRRKLNREYAQRREHQKKAEREKSLRGIDPRDSDARAKAYAARNTDSRSGKRLRQIEGRLQQAEEREASIRVSRPEDLGIEVRGNTSPRNALFRVSSGSLPLGEGRSVCFPDLLMQPSDRVALVGPNGSGKSTLIRHIVGQIALPDERIIYVPQEISAEESAEALRAVRALSSEDLGQVMAWVSRLGSEPARLLSSELPSPGEVRKLILARHLAMEPHLIVMDEPTNHMDLPSIECVETALAEFPGGLLLVSHDEVFLAALTTIGWEIEPESTSEAAFSLRIRSASCANGSEARHSHTREVG